jgi:hypothetical protein
VKYSFKFVPPLLIVLLQSSSVSLLAQAKPGADGSAVNLAVVVEGQVTVKRKGWNSYEPVVFGTNLQPGDALHLSDSSHAKVVCADITLHEVAFGVVGVPCLPNQPLLRRPDGSTINVTRSSPDDGSYPKVLSPRKTKLLSAYPVLRWKPVQGVSTYWITVRGPNLYWSSQVDGTETVYPDVAQRFLPGVDYKLVVQAGDRTSNDEPGLGLGFSVLDSKSAKTVEDEENRINSLGLPEGPTQFLIAHLYSTNGLNAEAIQKLERISHTFKAAAVDRLLGVLYLEVGLTRQAEESYLRSLDLSKGEGDEEGQMMVHLALARIYGDSLGNSALASQQLEEALVLANKIGDEHMANQTREKLAKIK